MAANIVVPNFPVKVGTSIVVDPFELAKQVSGAIAEKLNRRLPDITQTIKRKLDNNIHKNLSESPALLSLQSDGRDDLRSELGLEKGIALHAKDEIVQAVQAFTTVDFVKFVSGGQDIFARFTIEILPVNYIEILTKLVDNAAYVSTPSGVLIEWLRWLLQLGDRTIIPGYRVTEKITASVRNRSRSSLSLMIKGGSFRIRPQFSGTENDNFITRALVRVLDDIPEYLRREIEQGAF
jgi:hypothetical protein